MTVIQARAKFDFGIGPFALASDDGFDALTVDDRILVTFDDCELIFTVIGRARRALHLGGFLSPFEYLHWRCERHDGGWSLSTDDRQPIERLRRFCGVRESG